jgi:hypothetical protein
LPVLPVAIIPSPEVVFIALLFIHSFCSLSYDKSVASSKVSSPQGAI